MGGRSARSNLPDQDAYAVSRRANKCESLVKLGAGRVTGTKDDTSVRRGLSHWTLNPRKCSRCCRMRRGISGEKSGSRKANVPHNPALMGNKAFKPRNQILKTLYLTCSFNSTPKFFILILSDNRPPYRVCREAAVSGSLRVTVTVASACKNTGNEQCPGTCSARQNSLLDRGFFGQTRSYSRLTVCSVGYAITGNSLRQAVFIDQGFR